MERTDQHWPDSFERHDPTELERLRLVRYLRERCGIRSPSVLDALAQVPRECFVSEELRELAYADRALPIAYEQTISQPYIVALMTELANLRPGERVLEIGTGCGYQTAVLAATGAEVFSIEIVEPLARAAAARLRALGVHADLRVGDGHLGLPEHAPYMAILVTAAPPAIPSQLVDQLALGGRLIIPVGDEGKDQQLLVVRRTRDGRQVERVAPVRFVPMTGVFH
ncbi:MAG TPA: protein-L-isoaspartate(D-aspartate) O-methyltransferase [Polyangiales bacterium]|nr:protein-L-isoaspartate(D-aspartate) O-methyltransferase [Polyangiales bacterium]